MFISTEDERVLEFKRIMEWINSNKETWDRIIHALGDDMALKDETYIEIITELKEKQFYQLVLIMFHSCNYKVNEAVERAALGILSKQVNKRNLDDFIQMVIGHLEEMRKK